MSKFALFTMALTCVGFVPAADPAKQPAILAVGRLVEKKGFHYLIDACTLLKERGLTFECHIIGKGEWEARLRGQVAARGIGDRIKLLGALPQDKVCRAYRQSTVFALPCIIGSDGNRDGLPTVLLEAMATGLPAVTTTVTGNPEIVDDAVNGLLVAPNDVVALADALAYLLTNQAEREALGLAARQKVEVAFNVRNNVAQLHQWLAEPTTGIALPELGESAEITNSLDLPAIDSPTLQSAMQEIQL